MIAISSDVNLNKKQIKRKEKKFDKLKSKSSRKTRFICEERFACKERKSEARFKCNNCETYQCELCEELLHQHSSFKSHEREKLKEISNHLICELNCEDKNLADIYCKDCNQKFCFDCDFMIHSVKKKHTKQPFVDQVDSNLNDYDQDSYQLTNQQELVTVDLNTQLNEQSNVVSSADKQDENDMSSSEFKSLPDIAQSSEPTAIMDLTVDQKSVKNKWSESFLLIDESEVMKVQTSEEFCEKLKFVESQKSLIKVVSIFGDTGEGKSHTMNYTFFEGNEIFKTSPSQNSCTIGIWAAFDPFSKIIAIDTEGLLGISEKSNNRTRLLLKVLAVSDIVIYRTRAERLKSDLFTFLGKASKAYIQHFSNELRAASHRGNFSCPLSEMGPVVVIFHETLHTDPLREEGDLKPEDYLRQRFQELSQSIEAFSALEYVGTHTSNPPTNFNELRSCLLKHLNNSTVRSARHPSVIYNALKVLNEKFSGHIEKSLPYTFPDEYFTCCVKCKSCGVRCSRSINHYREGIGHYSSGICQYQHQYDNRVYFCNACYMQHKEINRVFPKSVASNDSPWIGLAKYAWSGYILECSRCGIIYRSRQYWYGNKDTLEACVRKEINHVWPGEVGHFQGAQNAAQRVLDGVNYLSETVSNISAKPTQIMRSWLADQIAPSYWVPNSRISQCRICEKKFEPQEPKHHCRACGHGFCEECSNNFRPVPERGWGEVPVRVCRNCIGTASNVDTVNKENTNQEITARKIGEAVQSTLGSVVSAIVPLEWIKNNARPDYWIPDKDISNCKICEAEFSERLPIHHCRACGHGVCDTCSKDRKAVPARGWDHPVRICDKCKLMSLDVIS